MTHELFYLLSGLVLTAAIMLVLVVGWTVKKPYPAYSLWMAWCFPATWMACESFLRYYVHTAFMR